MELKFFSLLISFFYHKIPSQVPSWIFPQDAENQKLCYSGCNYYLF